MSEQPREQLFVKIDGYRVILRELDAVKQLMGNAKEALEVLRELRDVKEETLQIFLENVDNLNTRLEDIGRELPEVEAAEVRKKPELPEHFAETKRGRDVLDEEIIETSIKDLHDELQQLKKGLQQIKQ